MATIMILRLFIVILAIGSVNCACTETIFSCARTFGSQIQSGTNICRALQSYVQCFSTDCHLSSTYEDQAYNNILSLWKNLGIDCSSSWSDVAQSFQDGTLFGGSGLAGMTTPRNTASSIQTLSSFVFIFITFSLLVLA